jgi:MFS family permease
MTSVFFSFLALCAAGFLARLSYALARTPLTPLFALLLGAGPEAVGFVVGASTITGIFFKLPAGVLSDIFGRRVFLLGGLCFFALPPFGYLLIETYWQLLLLRFVHGLATAIYSPVAMAVVTDIAGGHKGGWLSWFSSLTTVGSLLGPPLGGFFLSVLEPSGSSLYEFRIAYLVSGGFGVLALLTAWLSFPPSPRAQGPSEQPSFAGVWRQFRRGVGEIIADRRVVIASNMEGIQNLSLGALEAFLPVYAVTQVGLSAFDAGLLWAVQIGVTILAKPLMGWISDRWGRKPIITSGMMLCAVSLFWIPHTHTFSGLLGLALVFGGGEAFVTSSAAALVADLCEARSYGAAMGVFGTLFDIGHASGPILAGLLVGLWGLPVAFAVIAALLVGATGVFVSTIGPLPTPVLESGKRREGTA